MKLSPYNVSLIIFFLVKIVIYFTASWCGPCKSIQPAVNEFAEKYEDVEIIKIDVDELHVKKIYKCCYLLQSVIQSNHC